MLQFGPRVPLTPAETLLEPAILKAINEEPTGAAPVSVIAGSDADAGDILITCAAQQCGIATQAAQKLQSLVSSKRLPQPARSIRVVSADRRDDGASKGRDSCCAVDRSALAGDSRAVVDRRYRR